MSERIVGIDLGTTNSAIGVVESGFPLLLADEEGRRIVPSAVCVLENGARLVGHQALNARALQGDRVVTSVKRFMGETLANQAPLQRLGTTAEEISADILRELKRIATMRLNEEVRRAVISVPAYFHDAQRKATLRAGELAGLEVVRIINEPTAAALAYGLDQLVENAKVAVYDWGGGTFDLSILTMQEGVFRVLATQGDTRLGGDDIDRAMVQQLWQRAGLRGDALTPEQTTRWLVEAERVKRRLSEQPVVEFALPFWDGARSFSSEVTRTELEQWMQPLLQRTLACCHRALSDSQVRLAELDAVVMVGGSSRLPWVREAVAQCFQREVDLTQHPDEAIALGATIQAGLLSGALREMVLLDVTPLSLGIETFGGLMNVIIPRNTTIPCKAGEMFTNAQAGQSAMLLRVLQGEREMARDNWQLGQVEVPFQPVARGQARVGVQFQLDENGVLEVLARDTATGRDEVLRIDAAAVDVSDAAVERMISESVEHAFTDMAQRIWTEARLKADELLPAVQQALDLAGQDLGAEQQQEIVDARAALERLLQCGAQVPSNVEAAELKAAVQRLDRATEVLAAQVVERAMEDALLRRLPSS